MLSAAEKFPAVSTGLRPPRRRAQLRLARRWGPPTWHLAPAATRFKHEPETFESKEGERFLFQFGEGLRLYELPPKTRVIYPGVRSNGERDPEKIRERVRAAYDNPVGTKPLREKLRDLKAAKSSPKVVMAFDDVSVPLPPAQRPDLRQLIMEEAEAMCIEEGITDIKFICSIALHRFIRPDEFRELCGARLFEKYHPQGRMFNFNAVDKEFSTSLGKTRHGEDVLVCKEFVEADLCLYANVNFVAMDGGYKSYSTGMVHYECLRHNHDSQTLRQTNSLYDPNRSKMHKSFHRIGSMIQASTDIFHVETVVDDNMFPWYLSWVLKNDRRWNVLERAVAQISCASMRLLPLQLRKWVFWSPLIRAPFGLLQINAGETTQVHARTLAENYLDKVVDVDGQADILLLAPTCIGPYTKDRYLNPLLVNTYTLGYYYNMYIEGTPLLRDGGVLIVPNEMHYKWDPQHANYKHFFENVVAKDGGLDDYEKYQEDYATNEEFNENYRTGYAPAGVHGFYMYSWAARGMDRVGKVYVVGSTDDRGPQALKWEQADTVLEAVERAKAFLGKPDAQVTYWRAPPIGYARLNGGTQAEAAAD